MDVMRRALSWLTVLGSSFLLVAGASAADRAPIAPDDQESKLLLQRLSELSDYVARNAESPQVWRYQMAQGEVLLQLAARAKPEERNGWLNIAVDSYHSAMVQSPDNESTAQQQLVALAGQIAQVYPGSPVSTYAAMQEVRADYLRTLGKAGNTPARAKEHLRDRLVRFSQEYSSTPEAPRALMEAAQISEELGKTDDARRCYRSLTEQFARHALARKASGSLWRLGRGSEPMSLKLPLIYPTNEPGEQVFDLKEARSKVVVLYFWTCACPQVEQDLQVLKQLTDRYHYRGLEVVYVNLDQDPAQARAFLSGRLTAGVHVHQKGGLDSEFAESHGIQSLPQAFLVGPNGALIRHSLQPTQLAAAVSAELPAAR
jgi:hypothetical protein